MSKRAGVESPFVLGFLLWEESSSVSSDEESRDLCLALATLPRSKSSSNIRSNFSSAASDSDRQVSCLVVDEDKYVELIRPLGPVDLVGVDFFFTGDEDTLLAGLFLSFPLG